MNLAYLDDAKQINVFTLQPSDVASQWDRVKRFLDFGCLEWTPEFVKECLEAGHAQLWGGKDQDGVVGIVITRIQYTPHPWGLIWIASGNGRMNEGLRLLVEHIEPWLWEKGCQFIKIDGRMGWKKLEGYRPLTRTFVKVRQ